MEEFGKYCFATVFALGSLIFIAVVAGITPDGIMYGQWLPSDDHPTNWYDTALHPDASDPPEPYQ